MDNDQATNEPAPEPLPGPTGIPLLYEFNENLNPTSKLFLGDEEAIKKATEMVAKQGSIKK